MSRKSVDPVAADFLSGGGEMGARMRAHDWSSSALGPPSAWPQALQTAVGLMIDSRHPMFLAWGPELSFLYNDGYIPIFGKKHPHTLGHPFRHVWAEIWDDIRPLIDRALAGQATWSEDFHLVMERNGYPEDTWYSFSYSPIRDDTGAVAGMFCACTETTQQVLSRQRDALRLELTDHLRVLSDLGAIKTTAAEMLGRHLGVQCVGYAEVDNAGQHSTVAADWTAPGAPSVVGTHRLDDFGAAMIDAMRQGRTVSVCDTSTEALTAGNESAYTAIRTRAFINAPLMRYGRLAGLLFVLNEQPRIWTADEINLVAEVAERVGSAIDRARSAAELAENNRTLRKSEARFRAAIDAVQGILWTNDAAGEMQGEQTGWASLTGQSPQEYQGYGWASAVHPDDTQATVDAWKRAVAERTTFIFEHRVRRHDGQWRTYSVRAIPTLGADGEIVEWVGVHTDVTEQRSSEAALKELTTHLEDRVRTATAEREDAKAQVHELQKMETLGQLTGGIAHDFNNLLAPIVGCLEILRRKTDDERMLRLIGSALGAADRSKTLISRLLMFARREHLEPRAVDMMELMRGLEELVGRSLGPQVEIKLDVARDTPPVYVDPNQLELAVLNLAVNARDAMSGGGTLRIGVEAMEAPHGDKALRLAPGRYVRLIMADTGCGMDEETLRRAIDPFFTTKGVGKGTGLGLSMVHGLAYQSGGALALASRPGEGTTATLWLPSAEGVSADAAKAAEAQIVPCRPLSIALVDDEELVRIGTAELLADLGHTVRPFASALEALNTLQAEDGIDLLVTDYMMPGMTGAELVRKIRAVRPAMPAFLITGYASVTDNDAQGLPRLAKPFRQADLSAMIAALAG